MLICSHAEGLQVTDLPPHARTVTLLAGEPVELGRQRLPGFFERLLAKEPQWLGYISRSHCRLQLIPAAAGTPSGAASMLVLKVENLSANVVFLSGRPLAKGQSDVISVGGTLEFAAKLGGTGEQIQFLTFTLES